MRTTISVINIYRSIEVFKNSIEFAKHGGWEFQLQTLEYRLETLEEIKRERQKGVH